ncbi:AraC family transcriptional regulator [Streptomyces sp. M19]
MLDPIVRLLRMLDRPDDLRVLGPGIEREILWRLITGEQGALVRQIGLADGSLAHISRAIRRIRERYDEPLRVADLAELAGMSASSFHRHFRSATSMTPIQFQKQIRLRQARSCCCPGRGGRRDRLSRRLSEPVAVQPRIPADLRRAPGTTRAG